MEEKKHKKSKHKDKHTKKSDNRRDKSSSNSEYVSEELVENKPAGKNVSSERDDWMSMTGMIKTYSKDEIKPKKDDKEKKHIDSYNPATSTRELNPYWKDGGTGVPETSESFRNRKMFKKPEEEDDYYSRSSKKDYRSKAYKKPSSKDNYYSSISRDHKSSSGHEEHHSSSRGYKKSDSSDYYSPKSLNSRDNNYHHSNKTSNWKKEHRGKLTTESQTRDKSPEPSQSINQELKSEPEPKQKDTKYLSDEKMNKLAAKIIKAEIMGDTKQVNELKIKLEEAREYRKLNPNAGKEDDKVMLMSTDSMGNSRPLTKSSNADSRSKGGKRKAETHLDGARQKYFGNDDQYNLSQMFEQEKYGTNYDNDAQLAKIVSKHKNPNDDLEDIFTDEISKKVNAAKEDTRERDRAIRQHVRIESSLEGCEYCVGSKNMLKHLMVSCGNKVYLALPSRKSLVTDHCIITTIQHVTCVTALDEDVWEEIMDYRKALTIFFNGQDKDVVFFETAVKLNKFPHMVINCIPLPRDMGDMAAIYFKKALLECETEWAMNKKVIELKGKNIRKGVPKGLPYFWVDFAMEPGFAHVIEEQDRFPKNFAEEIIGGFLDLDYNLWKNPQKEKNDQQLRKVSEFIQKWKPYDTISK